jgi:hypothetical protein
MTIKAPREQTALRLFQQHVIESHSARLILAIAKEAIATYEKVDEVGYGVGFYGNAA